MMAQSKKIVPIEQYGKWFKDRQLQETQNFKWELQVASCQFFFYFNSIQT